jgi:ribulose 1,5-bisphosphate carboxylase large subunit-like protein
MIIAATWVDEHPDGMEAGARRFRDAWEALAEQTTAAVAAPAGNAMS